MGEDYPIKQSHDDVEICHVDGYKNSFKVQVSFDEDRTEWSPTSEQLFELVELWFESEDHEFGDGGYGHHMLWWYMSLIALGEGDVAYDAYQRRGFSALKHFEDSLDEYGDELMEILLLLKLGEKDSLPRLET